MKEFENGEEFIFDGMKKIPIVGAVYAIPRSVVYASSGNTNQAIYSLKGIAENGITTLQLIATPLTTTLTLGKIGCEKLINFASRKS